MELQKSFVFLIVIVILIILITGGAWYSLNARDNTPISETPLSSQETGTDPSESIARDAAKEETAASGKGANWSTSPQGPYHDKISYATSTDLLKWKDSGTIIQEHASVPDVMVKDGILYMYFVDVSTDGKPEQLGLMKSSNNGENWSERQFVTIKGIGVSSIVPVDPDPVLLADGRIRLYYYDISGRAIVGSKQKNKIYSAVSSDGINFQQEDGIRFEDEDIFDPDVIKVGDVWRLYVGSPAGQQVISAISSDGLTFTKEGTAYTGSSVPNAIYESGKYYLYTAGIQIATSTDGKTYTKTDASFKSPAGVTADPGVVKLGDKNYLMVYKTSNQQAMGAPSLGQQAPQQQPSGTSSPVMPPKDPPRQ